ncbi:MULTISPECIES: ATP-grasp domain-containing protein [unclassified Streptomyces]|uniref:ATP-grasp domain-containing protein n=1 Tax=unclassified Streptomyces TaxID=2593676 RepID=UPI00382D594A
MNTSARTLFLSPRTTATGRALATAAHRRGIPAHTLREWRVPAELSTAPGPSLYAGPLFADAVAGDQGLSLALLEADADWLARLPLELTQRHIEFTTLAEARGLRRPAFVKPPNDKSFPARVYRDGSGLPGPDAVDDDAPVLVSDIVAFDVEYRLFLCDGQVLTGSRYATGGELDVAPLDADPARGGVLDFAARLFAPGVPALPSAVVVDVGRVAGNWAVVEANAAWASGHYACDEDAVLDVVLRAAAPAQGPGMAGDARFRRPVATVVR